MEKIIRTLVNKFLGEFIDNLNADDLKISLLAGTAKLKNLSVKQNILERYGIPFTVKVGRVE